MADIYKLSEQVIDLAERASDVADAAQGKGRRRGRVTTRWFLLPAAGAGLYALVRSNVFSTQAKELVNGAKARASELPDDLLGRVRQPSQRSAAVNGATRRRKTTQRKSSARTTRTAA
jgi:hypothetical protein